MKQRLNASGPLGLILLFCALCLPAAAQTVPPLINYQGKLVNSNSIPLSTGDYELRFSIWDAATGGTQVWGPQVFNSQTGPGLGPKVPVVQGWFNVMLGPVDANSATIAGAFTGTNRFVQVQVGTNAPFSPRQQIMSTPYAFRAERAGFADLAGLANAASNASTLAGWSWCDFFTSGNPTTASPKNVMDTNAVLLTGNQAVTGTKTFSSSPVLAYGAPLVTSTALGSTISGPTIFYESGTLASPDGVKGTFGLGDGSRKAFVICVSRGAGGGYGASHVYHIDASGEGAVAVVELGSGTYRGKDVYLTSAGSGYKVNVNFRSSAGGGEPVSCLVYGFIVCCLYN